VLWLDFAMAARGILDGTSSTTSSQLLALGNVIDAVSVVFWPTLLAVAVLDFVWRRKRRPKDVLAAHGEAYVESTFNRVTPPLYRIGFGVVIAIALLTGLTTTTSSTLRPADVPGYATARGISSLLWAGAWALEVAIVWLSERHLARRMAKAADPVLAAYSVPFVEPETERGTGGELAGLGWVLRTAGLVLVGMFSALVFIGGVTELPTGKEPAVDLAFGAAGAAGLVLVGWAFVRRARRRRADATAGAEPITRW
jgi:hypothetical protein